MEAQGFYRGNTNHKGQRVRRYKIIRAEHETRHTNSTDYNIGINSPSPKNYA